METVKKTRKPGGGRKKAFSTPFFRRIPWMKVDKFAYIADMLLADDSLLTEVEATLRQHAQRQADIRRTLGQ